MSGPAGRSSRKLGDGTDATDHPGGEPVAALRPRLPTAERILPYLRRIDAARTYSNWGPLTAELEVRFADYLRLPPGGAVSAASGTTALVGTILATAGRASEQRPLALVPAFTWVPTAAAVEHCGYRPYLVDIDAETWMADPERLAEHPVLERVGLAVPVAPFGRSVPHAGWRLFSERTGVPVVIDGAASFDRIAAAPEDLLGQIPVMVSFHATKGFATGEGGAVLSTDPDLIARIRQSLNFGIHTMRESRLASTNGKMSEYHAAVGLAELDGWEDKLLALENVADAYRQELDAVGLADHLIAMPTVSCCYALFRCSDTFEAERVEQGLSDAAIDCRLWYGGGLHRHAYFAGTEREHLDVTDEIAPRLPSLPLAPDLPNSTVTRVVRALTGVVPDADGNRSA